MNLRIAAKVCKTVFDPFADFKRHVRVHYKRGTVRKAMAICRKRWKNTKRDLPHIDSDEKLEKSAEVLACILIDCFAETPEQSDELKMKLFEGVEP